MCITRFIIEVNIFFCPNRRGHSRPTCGWPLMATYTWNALFLFLLLILPNTDMHVLFVRWDRGFNVQQGDSIRSGWKYSKGAYPRGGGDGKEDVKCGGRDGRYARSDKHLWWNRILDEFSSCISREKQQGGCLYSLHILCTYEPQRRRWTTFRSWIHVDLPKWQSRLESTSTTSKFLMSSDLERYISDNSLRACLCYYFLLQSNLLLRSSSVLQTEVSLTMY